jgi:serine/threonine-protein kinase
VQVAVQIGRALAKAHSVGLVHRDLKPANVFLVRDEEHEIAKVLDFGVAKVKGVGMDGATKTGSVLGTPYYMSPEQARGSKDMDHRSDLWALAVVVYQCITGQLPFVADALAELMVKIVIDPIPVPSHAAPVPPSFDAWWARATSRDPNQRFQTAKEFGESLGLALGVTVTAGFDVGTNLRSGASGSVPAYGSAMMGSQSGLPMMGSQPGVVGGLPPQGATPMPMGLTPVGPMGAPPTGVQHAISVAGTPPRQGGRAGAFIVVGVLLGAVVAGGTFFALRARGPASSGATDAPPVTAGPETSKPQPSEAPSAHPSTAPVPSETAKPLVQPADQGSATAPAPTASAAVAHTPTKPVGPGPTVKPKANCDPNYTLDANGQKHFKPECFK